MGGLHSRAAAFIDFKQNQNKQAKDAKDNPNYTPETAACVVACVFSEKYLYFCLHSGSYNLPLAFYSTIMILFLYFHCVQLTHVNPEHILMVLLFSSLKSLYNYNNVPKRLIGRVESSKPVLFKSFFTIM